MAFDSLTEKLQNVFKNLRSKGRLTEDDVKEALKEIKRALLAADVNFKVVKDFIKSVQERAIGQDVMNGLNPGQMVIKIVKEEMEALMGSTMTEIQLRPGNEITIILMAGLQGAGKTTTIRIIMDVFHANSGEVILDGMKFNPKEHLIGYLPEERGLYPKKKVSEQLIYLGRLRGLSKAEAKKNTDKWLARLQVSQYADVKLETLSKGNQQKVQLASTLVCEPEIVILDEPFSGLDPVNSKILQDVVTELIEEGRIVIFSSHQMSYVEEFCEDIAIINNGEIALSGNLADIKAEYGKNQLIISAVGMEADELAEKLLGECTDILAVTGIHKDCVIVKNIHELSRNELLQSVMRIGVEISAFDSYRPSLNDIFVKAVGGDR